MKIIQFLQIIFAVLLIILVLIQNRGTGLSGVFGGSGNVYRTKRGVEKTVFILTIITSAIFIIISFLGVLLN